MYSKVPSKVLVLSPDSSASILMIWLAILSLELLPSLVIPNEKKSATIGSSVDSAATGVVNWKINPRFCSAAVLVDVPSKNAALSSVLSN